jgi:transcriptional regulator with XRE-family HTH domain
MFNERLKYSRTKKELRQKELAKQINVSTSCIAMWETGKRQPDFEVLLELAQALECGVAYLLGEADIPSPAPIISELSNDPTPPYHNNAPLSEEDALKIVAIENDFSEKDTAELESYIELLRFRARARNLNNEVNAEVKLGFGS